MSVHLINRNLRLEGQALNQLLPQWTSCIFRNTRTQYESKFFVFDTSLPEVSDPNWQPRLLGCYLSENCWFRCSHGAQSLRNRPLAIKFSIKGTNRWS